MEHYFGRVQALWKPVATEEAFEIVRRRLFTNVSDKLAAEEVCRAYADFYTGNSGDFPPETQESGYLQRLQHAYPIHPEVFDRLYEDWSSLDNFQRTRGVLKLMAKVIHRLWTSGNNDLMIQPGSLPLFDPDCRNEAIYYLPQGWDPVLERDIDGERAATTEIDNTKPLFGSIHACRRIARTVFLGSAPDAGIVGGSKHHRGLELERLLLGCAQPGQVLGHYKDGVRALVDRLQYINSAENRYWFDTRPNLRREMEDRKRRFDLREDVYPFIKDKLRFAHGVFGGIHVFTGSADVPDDWQLRLVVLAPEATFSRASQAAAIDAATAILKTRGDQPRQKQNRLIFLAPDADSMSRLKDQVTSVLAWKSIVDDVKEGGGADAGGGAGSGSGSGGGESGGGGSAGGTGGAGDGNPPKTPPTKKTVFFGSVELDPVKAKLQFSDVAEEVLMLFTSKPGVKVKVSLEIQAEASSGFDESTQRAARENCNQLKFKNHGFEE